MIQIVRNLLTRARRAARDRRDMSDLVFHVNLHYAARDLDQISTRERVEQALNAACVELEKYRDSEYIGYKIRDTTDLGD